MISYRTAVWTLIFTLSAACAHDETVASYKSPDKIWVLSEIDGAAFTAQATLTFPDPGRIAGEAPCNRYFADMTAPYPRFVSGPIASTRRICPDDAAERAYFEALSAMTLSEVQGDTLILSNKNGRSMTFTTGD
jgi:heat shock protein HslJ